jgi:DNA repair protein RecN (Recombination protein N)
MLTSLAIRDVVLIERLDLALAPGLNALTGETGAGKSIMLDALGLALGNRSEAGLVRRGAAQASVIAEFAVAANHPVWALLAAQDIASDGELLLRRVLTSDGKSRAYINDQPTSLAMVKQVAGLLVETHGQFDVRGLLDRETHRATLDLYAGLGSLLAGVGEAWAGWQAASRAVAEATEARDRTLQEEAFLREALADLDELDPQPGEDVELEEKRQRLAHHDKIAEGLAAATAALAGNTESGLNTARRALDRIAAMAGAALDPAQEALANAAAELDEAAAVLARLLDNDEHDAGSLETIDDRLFALRGKARRYNIELAELAAYRDGLRARLALIETGSEGLAALARNEAAARAAYVKAAEALGTARQKAATAFDRRIAAELPPLKFERARVVTHLEPLPESEWGPQGQERVTFLVSTTGGEPGPLGKIASGGELSRFMLALKVVLAEVAATPVMVFDEVDSGIGGATADAVGERLRRLGETVQVLVVTHSPQVAARAGHQWRVEKRVAGDHLRTEIVALDETERREEIARMLSGAVVTDEARAAAGRLLRA